MRRLLTSGAFALTLGFFITPGASAQQSVNIFVGGFVPRGDQIGTGNLSGRSGDDVLTANATFLDFNLNDFKGATVGGEWLIAFGKYMEGGLGVGYYSKTAPAVYTALVNSDGSEIVQDLRLRVVPFSATVRFLPLGRRGLQPYIGGGVGVLNWHYTETGQFVDNNNSIFRGTFEGKGSATGPLILGGLRIGVGKVDLGFETRYQSAKGNLPAGQGFAGSQIDLGGLNYLFTMNFRF